MPDFIRVFGAFPIARNDLRHIFADHEATTRHETADEACLAAAEAFARTAAYVAGVAFTRVIDLIAGECGRPEVIMSFGDAHAREQWANGGLVE
jgi:hypothetical protein